VKKRSGAKPTWISTCPFSQPAAGVQATGLMRRLPRSQDLADRVAGHLQVPRDLLDRLGFEKGSRRIRPIASIVSIPLAAYTVFKGESEFYQEFAVKRIT
jgi:hypothetical protein